MPDLEKIARMTHEVNRLWCEASGDQSQPTWDDAPAWQRDSAIHGIEGVIAGNTPEQSHESWLAEKRAGGWVYGEIKNPSATPPTHPCFVPYDQLPPEQKVKDHLFVGVAKALLGLSG